MNWLPHRMDPPVVDNWPPKPLSIYANLEYRVKPAGPARYDTLDQEGYMEVIDEDTGKDPEDQPTASDDVKVPGDTTPERDALPEQLLSENSDDTEEGTEP